MESGVDATGSATLVGSDANGGISERCALWKLMMDRGLFDDFYPHRLNASFQYLDNDAQNFFNLKDLINKGHFVFSYLGLGLAHEDDDSSFAIMDRFRAFDRSGRGTVSLEEFILWNLQYLQVLYTDHDPLPDEQDPIEQQHDVQRRGTIRAFLGDHAATEVLSRASEELLEIDDRATELLNKLDKGVITDLSKLPMFFGRLRYLWYALKEQLIEYRTSGQAVNLKSHDLVKMMKCSILSIIRETQRFFHISPERLISSEGASAKKSCIEKESSLLQKKLLSHSQSQQQLVAPRASLQNPAARKVWNLAGVRRNAQAAMSGIGGIGEMRRTPQHRSLSNGPTRSTGATTASSSVGERDHLSDDAANAMYAVAESTDGRSMRSSRDQTSNTMRCKSRKSGLPLHSNSQPSPSPELGSSNVEFCTVEGFSGYSGIDAELLESIRGMNGAPLNVGSTSDRKSQLHLLQAAFRSLNNFFNLSRSAASQVSPKDSSGIMEYSATEMQQLAASVQRREVGGPLRSNESFIGANINSVDMHLLSDGDSPSVGLINHCKAEQKQIINSLPEGKKIDNDVPTEICSGFEFELVQRLFEAQEELRRTRTRMEILEMVQEEAIIESSTQSLNAFVDEIDYPSKPVDDVEVAATAANDSMENTNLMGDGGGWISSPPVMSFDGIISELRALRTCVSERATCDYPLGYFLDTHAAVVPAPSDDVDETPAQLKSEKTLKDNDIDEDEGVEGDIILSDSSLPSSCEVDSIVQCLKSLRKLSKYLFRLNNRKAHVRASDEELISKLRSQQESLAEYKALLELSELDRSEFVAMNVELQMLREKNQRMQAELMQNRSSLELHREEHDRRVAELEAQISVLKQQSQNPQDQDSEMGAASGNENFRASRQSVDVARLQEVEHQKDQQAAEIERLRKENQRLKSAIAVSDQRLKGTLQDQVMLQHQVQQMEEETMNAKATITILTREVEEVKLSKDFREGADRTISELRREIHKRDVDLAEAREEAVLAGKYLAELQQAEKTIEDLENNISDVTIELEKGAVAIHQLDNYREQLRSKTREMRDMALHIHSLEAELKDMMYLQNRFVEINEELEEYRSKCEKLPALLSEQARLRGSSRASVKALNEQDKALNHLKGTMKDLQRECAMLRNENRAMQDLEVKLKEANQEIQRLMAKVSDAHRPTHGAGTNSSAIHEEKRSIEGQYKKMRKFIRQSAIVNRLPPSPHS